MVLASEVCQLRELLLSRQGSYDKLQVRLEELELHASNNSLAVEDVHKYYKQQIEL